MKYLCPICGYNQLNVPPQDDLICPSCGTHFGYDDYAHSPAQIRNAWFNAGAEWFSRHTPEPAGWSAVNQLRNLPGMRGTSYIAIGVATAGGTPIGASRMPVVQARSTDAPTVGRSVQSWKGFSRYVSPLSGQSVCLNS